MVVRQKVSLQQKLSLRQEGRAISQQRPKCISKAEGPEKPMDARSRI